MSAPLCLREVVAERLLATLALRGVVVAVDAGDLVVSAPAGTIEPHEVQALRDHKTELIGMLTEPAAAEQPAPTSSGEDRGRMVAALEAAAATLWAAHATGDDAAIEAAWQAWLLANSRYVRWSDAQPRGPGRAMDLEVAGRLRTIEQQAQIARNS